MRHRVLWAVFLPTAILIAQNCRPGAVDYDLNIKCACVKAPNSDSCALYKRNQSMYDGKGIDLSKSVLSPYTAAPANPRAAAPQQQRTPVSAGLLPSNTAFWRILPPGTIMAVGMHPQWLSNSPLMEQVMSLAGPASGMSMESVRRELAGVEEVIVAVTRPGAAPLVLARAPEVVRATKSERNSYRYVDPNTILIGDSAATNAAMGRLFSAGPESAESAQAGRVAAWSDVWMVMDLARAGALVGPLGQLSGATRMTLGFSARDNFTMEVWLDTAEPLAAKNLAARLQKNPQATPLARQMPGAQVAVEQRGASVRVYARVPGSAISAAPPAQAPAPAASTEGSGSKIVITGLDDGPKEIPAK